MNSRIIAKINIDEKQIKSDLNSIKEFPFISEEYSEFETGTWINNSLMNHDGDYKNTQYKDSDDPGIATQLWNQVPYITNLIKAKFNTSYLKMVRTRNLINGIVIPHKDFVEFKKSDNNYVRIFIPLEDNLQAFHSDEHGVFRMQKGEVWILNAAIVHAAANFSTKSRVFLCLDFQLPNSEGPESIFLNKNMYSTNYTPNSKQRESLQNANIDANLDKYSATINKSNLKEILIELSKIHFYYDANVADCYKWLISIAEKSKSSEILKSVKSLTDYMVNKRAFGERYIF